MERKATINEVGREVPYSDSPYKKGIPIVDRETFLIYLKYAELSIQRKAAADEELSSYLRMVESGVITESSDRHLQLKCNKDKELVSVENSCRMVAGRLAAYLSDLAGFPVWA